MLDAGLQASELLDLSLANARLQEGFIEVLGKGNKEGLLAIGRRRRDAIEVWLERFRPQFDPQGDVSLVFLSPTGQRMTIGSLEQMISRAGLNAGIQTNHRRAWI